MIRRNWRFLLAVIVVLAVLAGVAYWYVNRPAPLPAWTT